jgi:cytochrome c-type biogenesis protein CcmF
MIPEVGHFRLWLALAVAIVLGSVPLLGAQRGRVDLMLLARPCTYVMAVAVLLAFSCLLASFVRHDISVLYVASNSNTALPLQYRIADVWGGHEGSLYGGNSTA